MKKMGISFSVRGRSTNAQEGGFPLKQHYNKVKPLGQGTYGKIFLYQRKEDCTERQLPPFVAIKVINNSGNERMKQLRKREMYILESVQKAGNENIIKYFGSFEEEGIAGNTTVLVMEACNGDLSEVIRSNRELTIKEIRVLVKQILNGIGCLHNLDTIRNEQELIIHRDIKPANLLIKTIVPLDEETDWTQHAINDMTLVVGDFGLRRHLPAQRASNQSYTMTANMGTSGYMAPEVAANFNNDKGKFNERADIYSIGAIAFEMATGEKPNVHLDAGQVWSHPKLKDPNLIFFLLGALQREPKDRLNINQLISHHFTVGTNKVGWKLQEKINQLHIARNYIILGGRKSHLYFVDARTLLRVNVVQEECEDNIGICGIASSGDEVVTCGRKGQVSVYKIEEGEEKVKWKCVKVLKSHANKCIYCLKMDEKHVVTFGDDKRIVVHSRGSWKKIGEIEGGEHQSQSLHNVSFDQQHPNNQVFVPGAPEQLSQKWEVQMENISFPHSMILYHDELTVVDGDLVRQLIIMPSDNPKLVRQMRIENTVIKCVNLVNNSQTREANRLFWLGTGNGNILRIDLGDQTVLQTIQVWNKGYVRQLEVLNNKYLVCKISDPKKWNSSVLCYELVDLQAHPTSPVVPFRQIINFGDISSEIHLKGNQHLFHYSLGCIKHLHVSDIDKFDKTTKIKLYRKRKRHSM